MLNFIFFLPLLLGASQNQQPTDIPLKRFEFSELHMGTIFHLQFYAHHQAEANRVASACFKRIKELNTAFSDYDENSELRQLCAKAGKGPVTVSKDMMDILRESLLWSKRTDGAFDITLAPVIQLWRNARRTRQLPRQEVLERARNLVNYRNIQLDQKQGTVTLTQSGMKLDLGGIAKGFTADEVQRVLKEHGIQSACVAAGGDICVSQRPPRQTGWRIAIAPLKATDDHAADTIILENQAVSTSGDLEQFVEIAGIRYSHIVDPRTGIGVKGRMSCTVVAPRCVDSDAAATAFCVLNSESGMRMIQGLPGAASLFLVEQDQQVKRLQSTNWNQLLQK